MVDLFNDTISDDDGAFFVDEAPEKNDDDKLSTAAKYTLPTDRPLIGLDAIETKLIEHINANRLPHALLFSGPQGVGKASMAYRLARTLLTMSIAADEPVGLFGDNSADDIQPLTSLNVSSQHPVVQKMTAGAHNDFLIVGDDAKITSKSGKILIDDVRKINEFLHLTASRQGGWRVVILDNADLLTIDAQNAILKILEEPPVRVVLILIAHQAGALLATIRSRCQQVRFTSLADCDFFQCLKTIGYDLSDNDSKFLLGYTRGCPGQAISFLESDGLGLFAKFLLLWSDYPNMLERPWLQFQEEVASPGQDKLFTRTIQIWQWWVEQMIRAKTDPIAAVHFNEMLRHSETVQLINHYTLAQLLEICDNLGQLFRRAQGAALERRQVIASARMIMTN
jgi:DNA polymerase III subunit delta'